MLWYAGTTTSSCCAIQICNSACLCTAQRAKVSHIAAAFRNYVQCMSPLFVVLAIVFTRFTLFSSCKIWVFVLLFGLCIAVHLNRMWLTARAPCIMHPVCTTSLVLTASGERSFSTRAKYGSHLILWMQGLMKPWRIPLCCTRQQVTGKTAPAKTFEVLQRKAAS